MGEVRGAYGSLGCEMMKGEVSEKAEAVVPSRATPAAAATVVVVKLRRMVWRIGEERVVVDVEAGRLDGRDGDDEVHALRLGASAVRRE